jgi:protein-tyrosine phosphatase
MIDIHSHILPEVDDGPISIKEAVRIVKASHADGVTTMIATPHTCNGVYNISPVEVIKSCSELSRELRKEGVPMNVRPGAEVHLTHDIIEKYDKGQLMTMNNLRGHILLELPSIILYEAVIKVIRQFADRGVTVIIAHPERNEAIKKYPSLVSSMIQEGAMMQITAGSLTGAFGKKTMRFTERMLVKNEVALIASDIHPFRKFAMHKALRKVIQKFGQQKAEQIFQINPKNVIFFSKQAQRYAI